MHTKIVTVFLTGCALVSCADVQQAPDLIGKSLILETDRALNYDFVTSHEVRRTRERRPDMYEKLDLSSKQDKKLLKEMEEEDRAGE